MSKQYYCLVDGQEQGPYSEEAMRTLIANGVLEGALIKDEGPTWRTLKEMGFEGVEVVAPVAATSPKPTPAMDVHGLPISPPISATVTGPGRFSFTGSYKNVFALVEQAMADCSVTIKDRSPDKGIIIGKCKYGINPFGMMVNSTFHSAAEATELEITANFTDAVDTLGACKKKVVQISERLQQLTAEGVSSRGGSYSEASDRRASAPSYANRVGPSHKGKAVTSFLVGIGGLIFFSPAGIAAILLSVSALIGISSSNNKSGKGFAISGLVAGILCIIFWAAASILYNTNPFPSFGTSGTVSANPSGTGSSAETPTSQERNAAGQAASGLVPSEPRMTDTEIQQCRNLFEVHIRVAQAQARYLGEERATQQALQRIRGSASEQCMQYAAIHFQ